MSGKRFPQEVKAVPAPSCGIARTQFSEYLDGALDGRTMAELAAHLDSCTDCKEDFEALRSVQSLLGELGPAAQPTDLQAQLRDALASELRRGSYLSPWGRLKNFTDTTLAPLCVRLSAGLAAAVVLLGTTTWVVGLAAPVQANDSRLADFHAPRFLYSEVAPQPVASHRNFVAVMVEAKINTEGRVYDYRILEGPRDSATRARVEENLLTSVFKPATVFGEAVPGHAMITYTAVSVRG